MKQVSLDTRITVLLTLACFVLYVPGIDWGLPAGDSANKVRPWAPDELGPLGPVGEVRNTFTKGELGNPQYPFFHYFLIFLFQAPFLAFKWLSGGLTDPRAGYPFGFTDPVQGIQILLLISRSVSVLMGAGVVVTSYLIGKKLWDRATGGMAAVLVMLLYPMFYYSKISNVDVPAIFWCSLVLLLFVSVLKEGFTVSRALWMGVFAGLAVATKDGSYGVFFLLPLVLLPFHFRFLRRNGRFTLWDRWKAPVFGLLASAGVYAIASGLALRPAKYFHHLAFIRGGNAAGRFYFQYADSPAGYWSLWQECWQHLADSMGWPALLAAVLGLLYCLWRERLALALVLPIPSIFIFVLMPIRFVELRFVMAWGLVLSFFAARAMIIGWRSERISLRVLAAGLMLSGCALGLVRGVELAYIMRHDSRYTASEWLAKNLKVGERIEFFGPHRRTHYMPELKPGVIPMAAEVHPQPGNGSLDAEYVIAWSHDDLEQFWFCPRWVYDALMDGSLGYRLVADIQTPSLFDIHTRQVQVNPRVLIFARRDGVRDQSSQQNDLQKHFD